MTTLVRRLGLAEGASFLVLVGVAMPLKHLFGLPLAVRVVGLVHGLLFVAYVVAVIDAYATRRLDGARAWLAILVALLPFGPFVAAYRATRAPARPGDDE